MRWQMKTRSEIKVPVPLSCQQEKQTEKGIEEEAILIPLTMLYSQNSFFSSTMPTMVEGFSELILRHSLFPLNCASKTSQKLK